MGPGLPGARRVLCPGLQNEPGKEPGGGLWPVLGPPSQRKSVPSPWPRSTLQEGTPLLLRITLWDHPEDELQVSVSINLFFCVCHHPQGLGQPGRRPHPTAADRSTQTPHLGPLLGPTHPPEHLLSRPGAGDPTRGSTPAPQGRSAPPRPGPPGPRAPSCLPPAASPLTDSVPQRQEGP